MLSEFASPVNVSVIPARLEVAAHSTPEQFQVAAM
jgi:hypothetical protein